MAKKRPGLPWLVLAIAVGLAIIMFLPCSSSLQETSKNTPSSRSGHQHVAELAERDSGDDFGGGDDGFDMNEGSGEDEEQEEEANEEEEEEEKEEDEKKEKEKDKEEEEEKETEKEKEKEQEELRKTLREDKVGKESEVHDLEAMRCITLPVDKSVEIPIKLDKVRWRKEPEVCWCGELHGFVSELQNFYRKIRIKLTRVPEHIRGRSLQG